MSDAGGTSVRRPSDKSELIESMLRSKPQGAFATYRDCMVFAASLGFRRQRRVPFDASSGPIEWGTMINRFGTEDLVDVIAVNDTDDPEILDPSRLAERIRIFEAYANGGLEVLEEFMRREALTPAEAIHRICSDALVEIRAAPDGSDVPPDIRDLGKALGLG